MPVDKGGKTTIRDMLKHLPLIAILRGLSPGEASGVARVLIEAGFRLIEVPLNSPEPLESLGIMAREWGHQAIFGAGTVIDPAAVAGIKAAGGRIVVSPHFNVAVVKATKENGMISVPGVATPTEAFAAIEAGADALKIFPGELVQPQSLKAMKAVLPQHIPVLPVGGISADNMAAYWKAGAAGFGIGSSLYKPGRDLDDIQKRANRLVETIDAVRGQDGTG